MNLKTINVIIGREYTTRVKKKSFLITTFLVPILFAALCVIPSVLMLAVKEKGKTVAVVDQSGIVIPVLEDNEAATYTDFSDRNPEEFKNEFASQGFDIMVVVSPLDSASKSVTVAAYSKKPLGVEFSEAFGAKASKAVENYRINAYNIDGLDEIMEEVKAKVKVTEYTLDESGKETLSESGIFMIVSMVLGMVIYMFIMLFGGTVMNSVIEEKASRVVEVLISSVKSTELMFGKIIGVALVALTQFFMWIALTFVLVTAASSLVGVDTLMEATAQTSMVDPSMMAGTDMASLTEPSEMSAIFSTLQSIPYVQLIICFVIYFVFGYLLYASLFAAVGSAAENEADTQQLQIPITIPLMIAFFIVFIAFKNPESEVIFWGSMIPFTSPIVMLARIPYGVPVWQIGVSVVALILTFIACAFLSAKIYKVGILMFGKKTTFKDLWKWLRQ